jgi:hypothetical protein
LLSEEDRRDLLTIAAIDAVRFGLPDLLLGGLPPLLEFRCVCQKSIRVILNDRATVILNLSQKFAYVVLLETYPFKSTILRGEVGQHPREFVVLPTARDGDLIRGYQVSFCVCVAVENDAP